MNFVAFDFETANSWRNSPCAIGLAVVRDGEIVENFAELIRPPDLRFDPFNIRIHGIKPEHVEEEDDFSELWPRLLPYFEGRVVVAHNAPFDLGVLCGTLDHYGVGYPDLRYLCSLRLSRRLWPWMPTHRLSAIARFLDIDFTHHHAGEDAYASARIVLEAARQLGAENLEALMTRASLTAVALSAPPGD